MMFLIKPFCHLEPFCSLEVLECSHLCICPGLTDVTVTARTIITFRSLYNIKDKNMHKSHIVCKGYCSCGESYIGETARNVQVRIHKHSNTSNDPEPARHLCENPSHSFGWHILCTAKSFHQRKIFEGLKIQQLKPSFNRQINSYVAKRFPSGIT